MSNLAELARAKVNLTLHVTGRRPDGYHMLDSLVVFADLVDLVEVEASTTLSLTLDGPFAPDLTADEDNLVLRAARLFGGEAGAAIHLTKSLPVASGIGGGSADAAAALRALSGLWSLPLPDPARITALGADVPVCVRSQTVRMRGIGDRLDPVPELPACWLVLVNPRIGVSTPAVFSALQSVHNAAMTLPERFADFSDLAGWLSRQRNDLEAPARVIAPVIGDVLQALSPAPLARMSGSGATCFGLMPDAPSALGLADTIRQRAPHWWVVAAPLHL